ncbi:FAD-dependent oxidoreductase [uncultured Sunxiuqinia sp.]|uniref:FAD-dependent oxidoreductase n=1 Tax=uncultured Sunxiuqinia sp. TaxID=1573825 RepID=UPI002AA829B6|nr:FAD-dependent oxidoreductase [uncultured Sunxiuqinia sp.]
MKRLFSILFLRFSVVLFLMLGLSSCQRAENGNEADIIVYGGTSSGLAAAIQATRMGKSVIVLEPSSRMGGLTTGGLGQTDIGKKQAIGGIAREFYQNIRQHYDNPDNWKWQDRSEYKDGGQTKTEENEDAMWTFEPSAALSVFQQMVNSENIDIRYNQRLDLNEGVVKEHGMIVSIAMDNGEVFQGNMFIDATYEGDLMAKAGVSYTFGRESVKQYGESLNGVQTERATHHQFKDGVDPYVRKGDPESGLLKNVFKEAGQEGSADKKIQAYCFRMCLTDVPENRIPVEKPTAYDEQEYELLFRAFENTDLWPLFIMSKMPNGKTDSNNYGCFSSDYIGMNYDYPEGDYETREAIINAHKNYTLGLLWTLANHPRIPQKIRDEYKKWGLPKDEYIETENWSPQLYIREARRMVSDYVMTQHHCTQDSISADMSIGLGAYTMDSHNVQRYVTNDGFVKNEGNIEVGGFGSYPIDYRSIVPSKEECRNLLVPVCLSATHIAFGSIRMEPVFMVLGQSAATAASLAIDSQVSVQEVEYRQLRKRLVDDKQRL